MPPVRGVRCQPPRRSRSRPSSSSSMFPWWSPGWAWCSACCSSHTSVAAGCDCSTISPGRQTMAESEGAFRLTFVQGRGLLSLAGRDFEGLGRVDSLELEIPNLRFPFDLSGGVARFKNRRLRLRDLALFVGSRELTGFLARAPLAEFGIFDPRVTVDGSRLTLSARVHLGGHECEVTAVAL